LKWFEKLELFENGYWIGNKIQQDVIPSKEGIQAWMPFFKGMTTGIVDLFNCRSNNTI
jgi:hypothetical protein